MMIRVGMKGKLVLRRGKLVKVLMRPAMGSQVVIVRNWYHIIPQIMELRVIVILFVSVASGQSVEILFVFKSPFWTKKYKNVEFYRLKSLHFRYISKISKFRTKISDLGNFLYGICRFYAIYTKTTLTLQVQTKLSRKRELLGCYIPADFFVTQKSHFVT